MFRVVVVALVALLTLIAAAPSSARTKLVELRVEGDSQTLDPGTWYVTRGHEVKRGRNPECEPRRRTERFRGASALTVLAGAQDTNRRLRPVRVRPTDFGPQVCQIGKLKSFGEFPNANAGFLYYTNFESGFSSPDVAKVGNGDSVLWYHAQFPSDPAPPDPVKVNTGCVLELSGVPAHDADGEFTVQVTAHGDFGLFDDCEPDVSSTAVIRGAEVSIPTGGGAYDVTVGPGTTELFAEREGDVRSNRLRVCVGPASECPAAHGRRIVGSHRRDRLRGTAGYDAIRAGAGDDRISLKQGGRDRANCGPGDDLVLLGGGGRDRVARNCEEVKRS